jgi:hypothetical protein
MSERDPRVDPRKGDELSRGRSCRRVAVSRDGVVLYDETTVDLDHDLIVPILLRSWRKWAKDAEVISRAEDAATGRRE